MGFMVGSERRPRRTAARVQFEMVMHATHVARRGHHRYNHCLLHHATREKEATRSRKTRAIRKLREIMEIRGIKEVSRIAEVRDTMRGGTGSSCRYIIPPALVLPIHAPGESRQRINVKDTNECIHDTSVTISRKDCVHAQGEIRCNK